MSSLADSSPLLLGFLDLEPGELLIIGVVAVLLYGKRLPEVARNVGRTVMEFKRGLRSFGEDLQSTVSDETPRLRHQDDVDDHVAATAPKFEPPPAEPSSRPTSAGPSA